jgi:two-component system chemotaxis response regulator CheY
LLSNVDFGLILSDFFHSIFEYQSAKLSARGDRVRLSVERVFFYNFALDVLVILAALRHRVKVRPLRLAAAAAFGALVASYVAVIRPVNAVRLATALLASPIMARIASGKLGTESLFGLSAALLTVSAFMACILGSFSGISTWQFFLLAAVSAVCAGIVMGLRRKTLNTWEAQVLLACDGKEAVSKLSGSPVHMVITDLNMPNLDGIGLIRAIRANASYRFIPIIMLTTESQGSKKEEGKSAGATGWIVKPFKPEQLLAVVKKVLG